MAGLARDVGDAPAGDRPPLDVMRQMIPRPGQRENQTEDQRRNEHHGRTRCDVQMVADVKTGHVGKDPEQRTATIIMGGRRRVNNCAVAAGVTSMASTSAMPTVCSEVTTVSAITPSSR